VTRGERFACPAPQLFPGINPETELPPGYSVPAALRRPLARCACCSRTALISKFHLMTSALSAPLTSPRLREYRPCLGVPLRRNKRHRLFGWSVNCP
jgi:hypothetical protein